MLVYHCQKSTDASQKSHCHCQLSLPAMWLHSTTTSWDNVAYLVRRIMRCGIAPRIRSIIARCSRLSCVYANTTYHIHCRTQSSNRQVLTSVAHTKLQFLQFYYLFNINSLATCTNPTISNKLPLKTASANWTAFCINTHEPCQQLLFIRSRLPLKF